MLCSFNRRRRKVYSVQHFILDPIQYIFQNVRFFVKCRAVNPTRNGAYNAGGLRAVALWRSWVKWWEWASKFWSYSDSNMGGCHQTQNLFNPINLLCWHRRLYSLSKWETNQVMRTVRMVLQWDLQILQTIFRSFWGADWRSDMSAVCIKHQSTLT